MGEGFRKGGSALNGERLRRLYEQYQREVYLYLYAMCRNADAAEDLLQETFLKALLALPENHENFRAWLYKVARNLYFNYRKKEKRIVLQEEDLRENGQDEPEHPVEMLIRSEQNRLLYQALAGLEEKKREVLTLRYFGGLSQKEIASVLHLTPENVRVLAYRARQELKQRMEESGCDLS